MPSVGSSNSRKSGSPIKQRARAIVKPGEELTYTIVVTSDGVLDSTGVVLTDTLDGWQRVTGVTPVDRTDMPVYTAVVFDTSDLMTRRRRKADMSKP